MVTEQLLSEISDGSGEKLTALARRVPSYRNGRPATLSRLLRWAMHGVLGPGGKRVYLEAVKTPGGWVSTAPALSRFFTELTPALADSQPACSPTPTRTLAQRQRASERAAKQLTAAGI